VIAFEVRDMTCGHCVGTITQALKAADPGARVQVDLAAHRVHVEAASAHAEGLAAAITRAGFTPVRIEALAAGGPAKAGACCGCCH
jgi:copper chaperone